MAGLFRGFAGSKFQTTAHSGQHNPLGTLVRARGTGRYTFGLALSAGLAGLLYGYDTVSISGAIDFLQSRYALSPVLEGAIISSVMFGGLIGAAVAGILSDRFGRRRILMIGAAFFLVVCVLSALTFTTTQLIIARAFAGIGIGLTAALAVTYITESAPTHIRGTLAFSYQMLCICGIFLSNIINYIIASHGTPLWGMMIGWRWMLGIGAVPAAVFLAAMWVAPESPRFLIQMGRHDEGFAVLEHISGTDKARIMADDIADSVRQEQQMNVRFRDLFRPGLRKALVAGVFLAVFNQAIGMNVISYYGPVLFKGTGFLGDTSYLASACVGGIELVFTVIGMYLIDAVGRKRLMAFGSLLMAVFALGISWSFVSGSGLAVFIFIMMFSAAFAFSMGPIPWVMIPELFPTHLRARATGLCVIFLLATNFLIGQFTPIMVAQLGGAATFLIFAALDLVCLAGVLTIVPETMDRTLEDIEADWQPRTPEAAAKLAVLNADSRIRRAETTLARVENERMQALGIIEQAERDRVAAQKELFRLETEAQQRAEEEARRKAERAAAKATTEAAAGTERQKTTAAEVEAAAVAATAQAAMGAATDTTDTTGATVPQAEADTDAAEVQAAGAQIDEVQADMDAAAESEAAMRAVAMLKPAPADRASTADDDTVPPLSTATPVEAEEAQAAADSTDAAREDAALANVMNSLDDLIKK